MMKTSLLLAGSLLPLALGQTVTLDEVLSAAVKRAKTEEARVEVAQNQLKLLESQNKYKIELRPTAMMFAFSNPALMAANVGSTLLGGRRGAPSAIALKNAQLDVVAAELNAERLKVQTEIGAAQHYFDLLAKQQVARAARAMADERQQKLHEVDSLLKKAKVTLLDRMSVEQETLEMEQYALDAETQRKIAAANLANLAGFEQGDRLTAQEVTLVRAVSTSTQLPDVGSLLKSAMLYRKEPAILRTKIDALRKQLTEGKRANSRVSSGKGELGVSITLKDNGEKESEKELIAARLRLLELELENMEQDLRRELQTVRYMAAASSEKATLNEKKLELAERRKKVLAIRAQSGLDQSLSALLASERTLTEQKEAAEVAFERRASMFTLMTLCGVEYKNDGALTQLLGSR